MWNAAVTNELAAVEERTRVSAAEELLALRTALDTE
jgi:hypothetical protein